MLLKYEININYWINIFKIIVQLQLIHLHIFRTITLCEDQERNSILKFHILAVCEI